MCWLHRGYGELYHISEIFSMKFFCNAGIAKRGIISDTYICSKNWNSCLWYMTLLLIWLGSAFSLQYRRLLQRLWGLPSNTTAGMMHHVCYSHACTCTCSCMFLAVAIDGQLRLTNVWNIWEGPHQICPVWKGQKSKKILCMYHKTKFCHLLSLVYQRIFLL